MATLQDILIDANSFLDLTAELPNGDELATRVNLANQAVKDAAAIGNFKEFSTTYAINPSASASISLPTNFREFETSPQQLNSDGSWTRFDQIGQDEIYDKDTADKYCVLLGNASGGFTAVFNGLTANATVSINYQRFPSGMATLTDICELSDPQYVVAKVESYVLQGRSDDRFPIVEADAQRRLQNMLGRGSKLVVNETRRRGSASFDSGYQ